MNPRVVAICAFGIIAGCANDNSAQSEVLARIWIDYWNQGRPDDIPLAPSFVHTSPFGRIEGREEYLEIVKPMALRNVRSLHTRQILPGSSQAAIYFEMQTSTGTIDVCDWITVQDGQITEVRSFYDATTLRDQKYR